MFTARGYHDTCRTMTTIDVRHLFRARIRRFLLSLPVLVTVVAVLAAAPETNAQGAADPFHRDSKGKKFWVAFMANYGSGGEGETSDLRLYVSCDKPTKVRITYEETVQIFDVDVDFPNTPVEIDINALYGAGVELNMGDRGVTKKTIIVEAEDDITLYGVNIRAMSADAFLGLPDDILTRRYIVLAYPNALNGQQGFDNYDMPSQFAVIAIENGTELKVTPSASVNGRGDLAPFTVALDSGEVFFAQADLSNLQDVSGTELLASKPIAVFAGNRRTSIPTLVGNFRDHLVEQLPPLESWGKQALVAPLFNITPSSNYTAVVRVLSAFNGTNWTLDGVPQPPLSAARPVEIPIRRDPVVITADQPIMVAQYEHSVGDVTSASEGYSLGDPFMMLIPPPEQFDTSYAFQCVNHPEFLRHFVNVVIPSDAVNSLTIDGNLIAIPFNQIPGTRFSYAQIELDAGSHHARADSAFGLYSYGYGKANSYGYPGGTLFRTLVTDFQSPEISPEIDCDRIKGVAYDDRITDSGIDSLLTTSGTKNVDFKAEPFTSGADSVFFQATLIDPYQDGYIGVKAIDSGGRSLTRVISLPGFTMRATGMTGNDPLTVDTLVIFNGRRFCTSVDVENYGAFERTVSRITLGEGALTGLSIGADLPMVLKPGERRRVQICYDGYLDTTYMAQVVIEGECVGREIARVPLISRIDTTGPALGRIGEPCIGDYTLGIAEPHNLQSGIASIETENLVNCQAIISPDSTGLPASSATVGFRRIDPRHDMIYTVRLRDVVGNERVVTDTIGGFTLAVTGLLGDTLAMRLGRDWVGDSLVITSRRCDSVALSNYGARALSLATIRMRGNLAYSIPPSQLPITLAPGEVRKLAVCVEGRMSGDQEDTLLVDGECGINEEVLVKNHVGWISGTGSDICNNALSIQMFAASKRTFMTTPVPNPVSDVVAYVDVGLTRAEAIRLDVMDLDGNVALPILSGVQMGAGISRITFDISTVPNGAYFCRMVTAGGEVRVEKVVVNR